MSRRTVETVADRDRRARIARLGQRVYAANTHAAQRQLAAREALLQHGHHRACVLDRDNRFSWTEAREARAYGCRR